MDPLQQYAEFEAEALATLLVAKDAAAVEAATSPIVAAEAGKTSKDYYFDSYS